MSEARLKTSERRVALVTGATGFVGGHLVRRLLREGWQVHVVSRVGSQLPNTHELSQVISHIHDSSTEGMVRCVEQAKPDVVFHLASLFLAQHAAKDVDSLIQSNVQFGNQLLEAMRVNKVCRIINTGTSWQHYNNKDYNPVCLYAATKQAFEAILEYYVQACGFKAITLKLFDTYGPNDARPKLFYLLKKAAESGVPLDMSLGEQLIDLVHIDDVVAAYLLAADRLQCEKVIHHEQYAVSSGELVSLKELVLLYAQVANQSISVNWGARQYREREVMLPWSAGQLLPGWSIRMRLADGLQTITNNKCTEND